MSRCLAEDLRMLSFSDAGTRSQSRPGYRDDDVSRSVFHVDLDFDGGSEVVGTSQGTLVDQYTTHEHSFTLTPTTRTSGGHTKRTVVLSKLRLQAATYQLIQRLPAIRSSVIDLDLESSSNRHLQPQCHPHRPCPTRRTPTSP